MADNEKYLIRLHGKDIEVSEDVYYAYYRMERQERWQEEKKQEHDGLSYDAMDNGETVGAEAIRNLEAPSIEELIMAKELYERLHHAVEALPKAERELIRAIYFEGMTEKEYHDTEKPFVKHPTHPAVSSSFPAGCQYGGEGQSAGWLRPPNFLKAVTLNLILAKTALHDRVSGRAMLRYQGKNEYEWRENNEHP